MHASRGDKKTRRVKRKDIKRKGRREEEVDAKRKGAEKKSW